ncbi:ribokinase [Sphingomonas psychrotolerans]|uniref:Ribokinase n=1 Tax=Sphingomonas psychrotolerans TaxID=1327635 RepID=A0A2K8MIW2_9SPHN|nr:ribokinase [Sphingomonas psychrotolerans]ATY33820.1 ribokinase [Sphingomonas psychrotolerans]
MSRLGGRILVAGSANADFVVRASHIPSPGETVLGGDLSIVPGGKGANQAVAAARAGGAATAMLLALGEDASAGLLERSLGDAGVALHIVRTAEPTGAALITVADSGENAITVSPGANAALAPGDLPDLTGVAWLVMQLETPIDTVVAFARAARAQGVSVLLNVAPARAVPPALLDAVDVLVANEEELALIAGGDGSIVDRLAAVGTPIAIVTLGARGCCAWSDGAAVLQGAFGVDAIDTTAAGDTFCGTLAAALARGDALSMALRTASAAGALATTRAGAQSGIPAQREVDHLLATAVDDADIADLAHYCGVGDRAD